ncbi:hypothetical protein [Luteimonas saliphila]|uniref:hypothetical protein n=1 Tax=Luteimonas saliphila TaxID=2804919 RepID=UPI00192D623D|nr:hypothetical protein [Luteimonas saliphila]
MADTGTLYLVYVETRESPHPDPPPNLVPLAPGLYLAESSQTRSQLYHALKRRLQPQRLLVAALADDPKFKGMQAGALAWLRARGR